MNYKLSLFSIILLFSLSFSAVNIIFYHATGCFHCANTESLFDSMSNNYNLNITKKEVSKNKLNLNEMFSLYERFNVPTTNAGTPTVLINNKTFVIGEMNRDGWKNIFDKCLNNSCPEGIYSKNSFTQNNQTNNGETKQITNLTIPILIGAAVVDSLNPCTIAIMVMLLGVILFSKGRKKTLLAGLVFAMTIFVMYFIMGVGLLHTIANSNLTNLFFIVATVFAFVLSIMEVNAYFNYKPGFLSVEMPMFLRPLSKSVMKKATSIPGIITAAIFCSLFLLPCSSGPYLMVLSMLEGGLTANAVGYLLLYNFVFVLPMILITLGVYKGITTVEQIKNLRNENIRKIHLLSGVILFIIFLIMVIHLFGFF